MNSLTTMPLILFAMDEWLFQLETKKERKSAALGRARLADITICWAEESYWPVDRSELWNQLWVRPPYISRSEIDTEKAVRTMVRIAGTLAKETGRGQSELVGSVPNLVKLINGGQHVAAAALIEMGAPLHKDGIDISNMILTRCFFDATKSVDPAIWKRWKIRAEAEGYQAWERVPAFVREMSTDSIRSRIKKDSSFRDMLVMALDIQTKELARPAPRF